MTDLAKDHIEMVAVEREGLLRLALDLAATGEALDQIPIEHPDFAYARERVEVLRGIVDAMLAEESK